MDEAAQRALDRIEIWDRGFDADRPVPPFFAVPAIGEGEGLKELSRPLLAEDVRASFQAVADLAGYIAITWIPVDPENRRQCDYSATLAKALEDQARGLRLALERRLEQHDNETENPNG